MVACKSVYDPQEDSTLLERYVRKYAKGKVLDVGTGSGIQAIAAALNPGVKSILAADIQKEVINYCRKNIKNRKIKFIQSDLFSKVKGKFDTISFNPPYLPQELQIKDLTLEGGKKGYEVIEKFLNEVNDFLNPNGIILMIFSSLTKKEKVEEFIKNNLLDFKELEKMHILFEDIYVYMLTKNDLLKKLENDGIKNVKYFAKGHRGFLFIGNYKSKKVVVKAKNPSSMAFGRIENESKWLKKLNKISIGPRVLYSKSDYFVYEFIDGDFIIDYMKKSNKNQVRKLIKDVFIQMYKLDKLKVDKEEMHHPLKHVIISGNKPYLIDFERARCTNDPKNVTQFCQFVMGGHAAHILSEKGINLSKIKVIELAKIYKSYMSTENLKKIINLI
ncbi:MAG: HemK2/MTQ2 family protein methyltransferase [Nanoarchaeota archaeon]